MKPLYDILDSMPESIEHNQIHLFVNRNLGLNPDKIPKAHETYSISTIMAAMRQRGYCPVWRLQKVGRDHEIAGDETWWTTVPPHKWNGEYRRRE